MKKVRRKCILFFQKQSHISEHIGCNFTKEGCLAIVLETSEEYAIKLQNLWYVRKLHSKIWFDKKILMSNWIPFFLTGIQRTVDWPLSSHMLWRKCTTNSITLIIWKIVDNTFSETERKWRFFVKCKHGDLKKSAFFLLLCYV
jgi:hypothetical protein